MAERCPSCGLNWSLYPPVRIVEMIPTAEKRLYPPMTQFRPSDTVRCITCKQTFKRAKDAKKLD